MLAQLKEPRQQSCLLSVSPSHACLTACPVSCPMSAAVSCAQLCCPPGLPVMFSSDARKNVCHALAYAHTCQCLSCHCAFSLSFTFLLPFSSPAAFLFFPFLCVSVRLHHASGRHARRHSRCFFAFFFITRYAARCGAQTARQQMSVAVWSARKGAATVIGNTGRTTRRNTNGNGYA